MAIEKPSQTYPTVTSGSSASPMPIVLPDPSIQGVSFDQLLRQRGIRFIHSKAVPCPNMLTVDNSAHDPACTFCDNNGYLHYDQKEIWGTFGGNSIQKTFEAHGVWEIGSATVTCPTTYEDGTQADFNAFDQLVLPDFTIRLWELKEYEPRPGSIQSLRYPIHNVEYASSITAGVQKFYVKDVDFSINGSGQIVWIAGHEPAYNTSTDHGEVIVWSYFANPVYQVVQCLRELRITQQMVNGQKVATRLPQSLLVKRDFLPGAPETIVNP
jgi:hypothetical protein